jgi:hypothetical protein
MEASTLCKEHPLTAVWTVSEGETLGVSDKLFLISCRCGAHACGGQYALVLFSFLTSLTSSPDVVTWGATWSWRGPVPGPSVPPLRNSRTSVLFVANKQSQQTSDGWVNSQNGQPWSMRTAVFVPISTSRPRGRVQ